MVMDAVEGLIVLTAPRRVPIPEPVRLEQDDLARVVIGRIGAVATSEEAETAGAIIVLLAFLIAMNASAVWLRQRFEKRL